MTWWQILILALVVFIVIGGFHRLWLVARLPVDVLIAKQRARRREERERKR